MNKGLPTIRDYVLSQYEISTPKLQREFGLTYSETKKIIEGMLSKGEIIYKSDLTYAVMPNNRQRNKPEVNKDADLVLHALWVCIATNKVTARAIEKNLKIEFADALRLIELMEKNGYISPSPERKVLMSADEYIYKFGRRAWVNERVDEGYDVYMDDGIMCINTGQDLKERLYLTISSHIGNSPRSENEIVMSDNKGNVMFAVQEMPDYYIITDCGILIEHCTLSKTKIKNILKKYEFIELKGNEITLSVKSLDYVFYGLFDLYAVIFEIAMADLQFKG